MNSFKSKNSVLWTIAILFISVIASGIANYLTGKNIIGGIIIVIILIFIPFLIELLRKNDPIEYYGLDFETLKKLNAKLILSWAIIIFTVISLVDYLIFDIWNIIMNTENMAVGSISTALAKSKYFYLAIIVVFSGTFLEEIWFRGIIQVKIRNIKFLKKINPHFAIIVQSILFGLIHFISIFYGTDLSLNIKVWFFVYPAIIGIVIGYLNEQYHSLWPGWIIHYTNNLLSIILLAVLLRI
jgi:membrane protease YdiL (CAAX protease family)